MDEESRFKKSLGFVAENYDDESFSAKKAWRRISLRKREWRIRRIAAASAAAIVIFASSAFIYRYVKTSGGDAGAVEKTETIEKAPSLKTVSKRIEFNDAPVSVVVREIERVYGVKVINVPDSGLRLTLSYEGTAEDLVNTINELEGTDLKISE